MKPKISIILPTKEEEGAFYVIEGLKKLFGRDAELIVIDKDSSAPYINKLKRTGVTVVHQKSKGIENGLIEGFAHAHADVLATIDADGTHELAGLKKGYEIVGDGSADLVLGDRMAPGCAGPGAMPRFLWLGNWGLSIIYDILYRQEIHDLLTGMQVMSRNAYEKVKNHRPFSMPIAFFQTEIAREGFRVAEVPIRYTKRRFGSSKLAQSSKFDYGMKTARCLVLRSPCAKAFLTLGVVGISVAVVGLALFLYSTIQYLSFQSQIAVNGWIFSLIMIAIGFIAASFSLRLRL